ncbi:hypothetical protein ACQJBY_039246 [Aegilops geniculata]
MVKEKGNEKGKGAGKENGKAKGAGKENGKAKAKEKRLNYLIRQDSALPPPVPRKKSKPKVQIRKAKDFPNAPMGELIYDYRSSLKPVMVEALVCAASYIKGAHVDLNLVPRDENEEDDVETIKLPIVEEINDW